MEWELIKTEDIQVKGTNKKYIYKNSILMKIYIEGSYVYIQGGYNKIKNAYKKNIHLEKRHIQRRNIH